MPAFFVRLGSPLSYNGPRFYGVSQYQKQRYSIEIQDQFQVKMIVELANAPKSDAPHRGTSGATNKWRAVSMIIYYLYVSNVKLVLL